MTADELLKVNLATLCQQYVVQGPRRLEDVSAGALLIYFKGPCLKEESHRQFRAGNELLRDPVFFRATVPAVSERRPPSSGHLEAQTPPLCSGDHQNAPDWLNTLPYTTGCRKLMYAAASPPALFPLTTMRSGSRVTLSVPEPMGPIPLP